MDGRLNADDIGTQYKLRGTNKSFSLAIRCITSVIAYRVNKSPSTHVRAAMWLMWVTHTLRYGMPSAGVVEVCGCQVAFSRAWWLTVGMCPCYQWDHLEERKERWCVKYLMDGARSALGADGSRWRVWESERLRLQASSNCVFLEIHCIHTIDQYLDTITAVVYVFIHDVKSLYRPRLDTASLELRWNKTCSEDDKMEMPTEYWHNKLVYYSRKCVSCSTIHNTSMWLVTCEHSEPKSIIELWT